MRGKLAFIYFRMTVLYLTLKTLPKMNWTYPTKKNGLEMSVHGCITADVFWVRVTWISICSCSLSVPFSLVRRPLHCLFSLQINWALVKLLMVTREVWKRIQLTLSDSSQGTINRLSVAFSCNFLKGVSDRERINSNTEISSLLRLCRLL